MHAESRRGAVALRAMMASIACALLALACIEDSRPALDPAPREPKPEASASPASTALAMDAAHPEDGRLERNARSELELATAVAPRPSARVAPGSAEPPARLLGLVLDSRSEPIRGARVTLASSEGAWREGVFVPEIELGGRRLQGYVTTTDAAGRFAIDAPIPTSHCIELRAEDGPTRTVSQRRFGVARGCEPEPILAGDNDLGVYALHDAARVRGRVLAASGESVEGAVVLCMSDWQFGGRTESAADGSFELDPVLLGMHTLSAWASGFERFERVLVLDEDSWRNSLDLVLTPKPAESTRKLVKGIVVDPEDRPVPDCIVFATTSGGCSFVSHSVSSDEHGRFEFDFADPRDSSIGLDPGTGDWIGRLHAERGTLDDEVRLVLRRPSHLSVRVVDAGSGMPIERTWIELCHEGGSQGHRIEPLEFGTAANGLTRVRTDPGAPWIRCAAPGYAPYEGPIALDSADPTLATVRLKRGARVHGRIIAGAHATLRLVGIAFPRGASSLQDEDESQLSHGAIESSFLGRMQTRVATAGGEFEFNELASGAYRLTIHPSQRERLTTTEFVVHAGRELDLGPLQLDLPEPAGVELAAPSPSKR